MQECVVREIRTLRAMWRALETGSRQVLNGHEGGNPGHKPRMSLRATAPVLDPTNEEAARLAERERSVSNVICAPSVQRFTRSARERNMGIATMEVLSEVA